MFRWHIEPDMLDVPSGALLVRGVHVFGMALVVGGALLTWLVLYRLSGTDVGWTTVGSVARTYEWLFWSGMGLLVLTGVGNLGALAPAVPGSQTRWGATFALKLVAVLGLLVLSVVRTFLVHRLTAAGAANTTTTRLLGRGYGLTAVYMVGLLALAEVLVYG